MNFEEILEHHLLDHSFIRTVMIDGVNLGITKHILMMWIVGGVLLLLGAIAANAQSRPAALLRLAFEAIILFVRDEIVEPSLGHSADFYLPYFLTLFLFILGCNLAGLVPYGATATGNISVTAALALCTFGLMQVAGMREQGIISYLKHIAPSGVPFWVLIILYPIELLGMVVKCIALCIRLFANMIAGHIVSLAFLSLIFIFAAASHAVGYAVSPISVGLALFVNCLDLLVALLQAYIFTLLTALFVGMSAHPH